MDGHHDLRHFRLALAMHQRRISRSQEAPNKRVLLPITLLEMQFNSNQTPNNNNRSNKQIKRE